VAWRRVKICACADGSWPNPRGHVRYRPIAGVAEQVFVRVKSINGYEYVFGVGKLESFVQNNRKQVVNTSQPAVGT
jgi:hypothetical protein